MKYIYETKNTCAKIIEFDIDESFVIRNVRYLKGGCPGNLQAVPKLVEGLTVDEITEKIGGIMCGIRGTSCANELVKAINEAKEKILSLN